MGYGIADAAARAVLVEKLGADITPPSSLSGGEILAYQSTSGTYESTSGAGATISDLTDITSFTDAGISWTANTTVNYAGWKRDGKFMILMGRLTLSGAPTTAELTIPLPGTNSVDSSLVSSTSGVETSVGTGTVYDADGSAGETLIPISVIAIGGEQVVRLRAHTDPGTAGGSTHYEDLDESAPITFASGDEISWECRIPITGFGAETIGVSTTSTVVFPEATEFTSTATFSWSNITIDSAFYHQRGNLVRFWGKVTGTGIESGPLTLTLPNSWTVDSSAYDSDVSLIGTFGRFDDSATQHNYGTCEITGGSGTVRFGLLSDDSTAEQTVYTYSSATDDIYNFDFEVPITGLGDQLISAGTDFQAVLPESTDVQSQLSSLVTGWSNNITYTGADYQRVGSYMIFTGQLDFTGAVTKTGPLRITLPDSLSMDSSKINLTHGAAGSATWWNDGASPEEYFFRVVAVSSTQIEIFAESASASFVTGASTQTNITIANNDIITWNVMVPIDGWADQTLSSLDRRAQLSLTSNATGLTAGAFQLITFDEATVSNGLDTTVLNRITIEKAGRYQFVTHMPWTTAEDGSFKRVRLTHRNSGAATQMIREESSDGNATYGIKQSCILVNNFAVGDYVQVNVRQETGTGEIQGAANDATLRGVLECTYLQ